MMTNRKSHTRFRLVPKSKTLDDLEGSLCTLFSTHPVAQFVCCECFSMDHFLAEAMPTEGSEGLTETVSCATLSSSKQLLN